MTLASPVARHPRPGRVRSRRLEPDRKQVAVIDNEVETARSVTGRVTAIVTALIGGEEHSTAEIARLTGIPMSSTYRLTAELAAAELIERTDAGGYRAGSVLRLLVAGGSSPVGLLERARHTLDDLSRVTNSRVRFGVLDRMDVVYLERIPGRSPSAADLATARQPAPPTALGRALLAFSPVPLVELILARGLTADTPRTVTSADRVRRTLAAIRQTHVALTCGELENGRCTVAMPVFGPGGGIAAALELAVADLNHDLMRSLAILEIASRALTRELAAPHLPVRRFAPVARTADLQLAAVLSTYLPSAPEGDTR